MIDLSKIKAPGWQRVVEDLARPAPDDRTFLARLLAIQVQVSGARQGVLFSVPAAGGESPEAEPRPTLIWPSTREGGEPVGPDAGVSIEHASEVRQAARTAGLSGQTQVYGLDKDDGLYDHSNKGYVIAAPVPTGPVQEGGATQVLTLLIEHRSKQALQTTLAIVEVLSGYVFGHAARRELARTRASTAALDLATRLIGSINSAKGFRGACMQVCNDLCRQLGLDRAAIGWVRGIGASGSIRTIAMSDTEQLDRRMAMVRKLEAAMDECLDQEQAVLYPAPPSHGEGGDVVLGQAIAHAHRELAAGDAKLRIASVPLRADDDVLGVLTIESAAEPSPLGVGLIELIQATMDLVSPVLAVRRSDDRHLAARTAVSARRAGAWLVGPRHTIWKLGLLTVTALVLVSIFVHVPYRIEAAVELQPREQRIVSAPFDGVLERLGEGIEKGVRVREGDVLLTFQTIELNLMAQEAITKLQRARTQADAALREGKLEEADQANQEVKAVEAQLRTLEHRLEQAVVRSPMDGVIVDGDLKGRTGSTIKLGEPLFVVADLEQMVGVAKVSDRDISYISTETTGRLATKAAPDARFGIHVERVVPMGRAEEGRNVFEVRVALDEPADWMRPGMEGLVKLDTGDRPIAWILTRRITDTVRMWLWW
ncbi:MAG: efflux RND transporter periplasmic adaptor subunit [Phycisphaeraceae bacterium]|nr:efflux RND transporter periplasmic adaptor subunit [Phycisphaeraceae bacterium]MCW5753495.1 efflux RND transporter periplasmic adaptor subunit [Phycisphaeraceae bacterium]